VTLQGVGKTISSEALMADILDVMLQDLDDDVTRLAAADILSERNREDEAALLRDLGRPVAARDGRVVIHPEAFVYRDAPRFFRRQCRHARLGGGATGYRQAGYELAPHFALLVPERITGELWLEELGNLAEMLRREEVDEAEALGWLAAHLPGCLALVPWPRRGSFLAGVRSAVEDGVTDWG
jgi:hypothetical protein